YVVHTFLALLAHDPPRLTRFSPVFLTPTISTTAYSNASKAGSRRSHSTRRPPAFGIGMGHDGQRHV
ncbi:MAG: hypothetical protein K0V04_39935, partial [Deltaproteobacteria bacterium]|nr:hypothetical protein [Deltaproteobacteria bacterium]